MGNVEKQKTLASEIDEIGTIRRQIAALKEREEALATHIKAQLGSGQVVMTDAFRAEKVISQRRLMNFDAVRKIIGQKRFLAMATVSLKDLEKIMGKEEIDSCTKGYTEQVSLTVTAIS